jgi:hypothetical protein
MPTAGLNDSFTEEGFWWLEGNEENEVAGTLTFGPEDGPVLKLLGTLQDFVKAFNASLSGGDSELVTIHGVTKKGKKVTLLRAFNTNRQMNMPGIANETWNSNLLVVGWHLSKSNDPIFSKSYFRFQEIERWLEHNPFTYSLEPENKVVTLRAEKPREETLATLEDLEVTTVVLHRGVQPDWRDSDRAAVARLALLPRDPGTGTGFTLRRVSPPITLVGVEGTRRRARRRGNDAERGPCVRADAAPGRGQLAKA